MALAGDVERRIGRLPVVLLVSAIGYGGHGALGARVLSFRDSLERRGWHVVPVGFEDPAPRFLTARPPFRAPARLVDMFHDLGFEGEVGPRQALAVAAFLRSGRYRADAAVVLVPPHSLLWVVRGLSRRMPVVIDYQDDLSVAARPTLPARLLSPLERSIARRASGITFSGSLELRERIAGMSGLPAAKVVQIKFGIDPADLPAGIVDGSLLLHDRDDPRRPLDLVYAGHIYGRLRPDALLRAVVQAGPDVVRLEFIGTVEPRLRAGLRRLGSPGVTWRRPLPRPELYERLALADAGTVCLGAGYPHELAHPAKTYEYLALGLPVIAMCPPRSAVRTLGPPGSVIWFDDQDPDALSDFLARAWADRRLLPRARPDPARYDRDAGVAELDALLRTILGPGGPTGAPAGPLTTVRAERSFPNRARRRTPQPSGTMGPPP